MDLDTVIAMEEGSERRMHFILKSKVIYAFYDSSNEATYLRLSERLCALSIIDEYLKDSDSIFNHERKDEMLTAVKVLLPDSEYAQREAL